MAVSQTIVLTDIRDRAAAALAPVEDTDPAVFADIVEAVVPPALLIGWDDPWLEPGPELTTFGPCIYRARLRIVLVAARLEPGPGGDEIDRLAVYVLGRMRADPYPWAFDSVERPVQTNQAGIDSLWATATYTVQTSI